MPSSLFQYSLCLLFFLLFFLLDLPVSEPAKGVKTMPLRQLIQKARMRNAYSQRRKHMNQKNSTMIDYSPEDCPHCKVEKCADDEEELENENAQDLNLYCYVVQSERNRKIGIEPVEHCATGTQLSRIVKQNISMLQSTWEACHMIKDRRICWCRIEIEEDEEEYEFQSPQEEFVDDRPYQKSRLNMIQQRSRGLNSEKASDNGISTSSASTTSFSFYDFFSPAILLPLLRNF